MSSVLHHLLLNYLKTWCGGKEFKMMLSDSSCIVTGKMEEFEGFSLHQQQQISCLWWNKRLREKVISRLSDVNKILTRERNLWHNISAWWWSLDFLLNEIQLKVNCLEAINCKICTSNHAWWIPMKTTISKILTLRKLVHAHSLKLLCSHFFPLISPAQRVKAISKASF